MPARHECIATAPNERLGVVEHNVVAGTGDRYQRDAGRAQLAAGGWRLLPGVDERPWDGQAQELLAHCRRGAAGQVDGAVVQRLPAGQPHGGPPVLANPVPDLLPAAGQELRLGVGGDPAAARFAVRHVRIEVRVYQDEAGDETGVPAREDGGHGPAHAVCHQLCRLHPRQFQCPCQHVGVILERVAEGGRPVAEPEAKHVDQQGSGPGKARISGHLAEVSTRHGANAVDVDAGRSTARQFGPAYSRTGARSDLAIVPVTGLGPIVMAPVWSEPREDPMIHTVAKIASRLGRQRGWDRVP